MRTAGQYVDLVHLKYSGRCMQLNPHDDKASTYVSRPRDLWRVTTFHVGTFIIESIRYKSIMYLKDALIVFV